MASYDRLAVASAVGRAVPRVSVGTAVGPIYPRHPQTLASAANPPQAATGGRGHPGIGAGGQGRGGHAGGGGREGTTGAADHRRIRGRHPAVPGRPKALEQHIIPVLTGAAAGAGRPAPRVIVTVPAVVTDKVEQVIASATAQLAFYEKSPPPTGCSTGKGWTEPRSWSWWATRTRR